MSGGDCIEDINTHLKKHLKAISNNRVPSQDMILRCITEFSTKKHTVYIYFGQYL